MKSGRLFFLLAIGLLHGCATQKLSGDQLARVAKDWSLSIRASQVIPVYPLTEDLQPGDVFLVQTPIEEQVRVYLDKGFLPLENLVTRLSPLGYARFYRGWPHVADGEGAPPRYWQFPKPDSPDADYSGAPLAAFPTYNFSVSRSGGLNVAIPVQSVPVGLNLLDSASANGTITLKDAFTYALPTRTMFDAIQQWCRENVEYLKQYEPSGASEGKQAVNKFYLRVINRVYLVKTFDVSLFSNKGFGLGGSAGVPQPVQLLNLANATEAAKQFAAVNEILSKASSPAAKDAGAPAGASEDAGPHPLAAGGTVKLAMATSRSVSLVETFRRPLVIGYLASDFPIGAGGKCASPVPTLGVLEGHAAPAGKTIEYMGCDENCLRIRPWIKQGTNQKKLEAWLEKYGGAIAIADLLTGDYAPLRQRVVAQLIEGSQ